MRSSGLATHRRGVLPPEHTKDDEAFRLLRDVVVACLDRAGRAEEDRMPSVLAMWGGVHGIAALRLDGPLAHMGMAENELCEEALGVLCPALDID